MTVERISIGTRGSKLALWQAHHIKSQLTSRFPSLSVEIRIIKTLGDKILDSALSKIGDKGLFTKEIEHALLAGEIDLAVHSLKDIPTKLPDGLIIGAVTEREDVRDVFLAHPRLSNTRFAELPQGATIATGSLRRACQILSHRPDLRIVDIRGNLNTRIEKFEQSDWHGMILAKAGLTRLGLEERISEVLSPMFMLPAVGQGALGIEVRGDDTNIRDLVHHLHHEPTAVAVTCERALLRRLEGGCQIPIGTYGRLETGELRIDAMVGSLDGTKIVRGTASGKPEEAETLGSALAEQLLNRGGREILDAILSGTRNVRQPEA
ncbi:MAG TPA: hydroxymethylbilane synthase [Bacteroidota bacterium]|nr:hydroxymethylbilane synthase [Bacteroidota bacterium]